MPFVASRTAALRSGSRCHIMRIIPISRSLALTLSQLVHGADATVTEVLELAPGDAIARRLRVLGFVDGEQVRIVGAAPLGGDPLLVQVGFTRFALRRSEADRVRVRRVQVEAGVGADAEA
jgi:ferrous iron transport protein A